MRKINIIANYKYGEYRTIKSTKQNNKFGWICEIRGEEKFIQPYILNKYISHKEQENLNKLSNQELLKSNKHQMGIRKQIYSEYQNNSLTRGFSFDLNFIEFNNLIIRDCHYCGEKPVEISKRWKQRMYKTQPILNINGIDRVNSLKGYSIDNCVSCCTKCNLMKNIFSKDDFINHVNKICNFNKKGSTTIPEGSTLQVNGSGNGISPHIMENDIV